MFAHTDSGSTFKHTNNEPREVFYLTEVVFP